MDLSASTFWWVAAGVAVAVELATGTFYLLMIALGLAGAAVAAMLNLRKFIEEVRFKNSEVPIYLYGETRTSQHLPNDILRELHGFIHMFEDTPEFVARHIIREAKSRSRLVRSRPAP